MKNIYQIIIQIIIENQEVELPEFGKFVGEEIAADIHPVDHKFTPKHLKIDFELDKNVVGLLIIEKLAKSENISLHKSKELLKEFRNGILNQLKAGEKVVFKELGYMYWKAGHLYFEQDLKYNYLKESFGLSSFSQKPHGQKSQIEAVPPPKTEHIKESKSYRKLIYGSAASLIIIALAALVYLRWEVVVNVYEKIIPKTQQPIISESEIKKDTIETNISLNLSDTIIDTDSISEIVLIDSLLEKQDTIINVELAVNEDETTDEIREIANQNLNEKYYLIAACFKNKQNALDYVQELNSKGYKAELRGKTNGLHRVIYSAHPNYSEALKAYKTIKDKVGGNPWVQKI